VKSISVGNLDTGSQAQVLLVSTTVRWALLIGFAALTGCAGGTSPTLESRASAQSCRTVQLHGSFSGFDAGAGQRYVQLTLTNVAKVRCSVSGYPGLQLVAVDGRAVPTEVVPSDAGSLTHLTIAPGRRVSSVLHWIGIPLDDEAQTGPCELTPAHVNITPPGDTTPLPVAWSFGPVCGHGRIDPQPLRVR
jgi:hypothetical protein